MTAKTVELRIKRAGERTGCSNSPESNLASSGIRAMLKYELPDYTLHFSTGHYYCSGFLEKNGKFVYFSFSDYRFFGDSAFVRTAAGLKDYSGGRNNDTTSRNLVATIRAVMTGESFYEVQ